MSSSSSSSSPSPSPPVSASSAAFNRFLGAAVGAGVAETLTLPIDAIKVRLQLQNSAGTGGGGGGAAGTGGGGSAAKPRYTGFFQGIYRIAADEGAAALWRGIEPALVRQILYTGMSFVLYEPVRNAIAGNTPKEEIPFYMRVLAGGTAGALSIVMMNPTDVVKTQMQAYKGLHTPKMSTIVRGVYQGAGVMGFWRGVQPNVARAFIGNACEIGCYDEAKQQLLNAGVPDGPLGHFGASGVAGTVSAVFSTPVDVVKTRLMAQAGGAVTEGVVKYRGVVDCFVRMPQLEGFASLYKGFVPLAARKVCWTVAYFLTYEQAMKLISGSYS